MRRCTNKPSHSWHPISSTTTPQHELMTAAINLPANQEVKSVPAKLWLAGADVRHRCIRSKTIAARKQRSGQQPNRRAVLLRDWHGLEGYRGGLCKQHFTASATPVCVLLPWLTIWRVHFIRLLEVTTNNAISELPPPFFLYCSQKLFFWLCEICMSLRPKSWDYCLDSCFFTDRELFFFLFFSLSPKKRTKKQFEGEATTWKDELEKLSVYEPAWHSYISFHVSSRSLVFELYWWWAPPPCVFTATFAFLLWSKWPRKVMVTWTVRWLGRVQVGIEKDKLWHDFGGYSSLLLINEAFLGSLLKIKFGAAGSYDETFRVCCCLQEEHRPNLQETEWHAHIKNKSWWHMELVLVTSFVNGHICIDENSIWETVLRAYPSWVQVWGAFWLPQLQTASLWSSWVALLCALTDSQHRNIFIFSKYLLYGKKPSALRSSQLFHEDPARTSEGRRAAPCPGAPRPVLHRHPTVLGDGLHQLIFPWHHAGKLWQNADDLQTRGAAPAKWKHPKYLLF